MRKLILTLINSKLVLGLLLLLAIAPSTPHFNYLIANSMAFHMLFQIPLLILAGYLIGRTFKLHQHPQSLNSVFSSWLWFLLATLFWMLPISLDKALLNISWDIFKIISLIFTGVLLTISLAGSKILSLFFIGSTVMMLFFIGYYYQDTTLRLCNSYLIESQQTAGTGLIAMAFIILVASAVALYKET